MKKLHLYFLKSYLGPFIATFFVALFVILMQFLWKYIDDMVGKGLEWTVIIKLLFYASATFVPLALPLAVLLSSLMTFGNLGERYELVAIKAAGISLGNAMRSLVVASLLICGAAFYFANNILPVANLKMASLLYDVREQKPALNIKEGIYYKGIENFVIKVEKKDADNQTIHNVIIYDHTDHLGNINMTLAEWGKMELTPNKKYLIFSLHNGTNYYEDPDEKRNKNVKHSFRRTNFKEEVVRFDLSSFTLKRTNEELFKDNYQMLNLRQLDLVVDSLTKQLYLKKKDYIRTIESQFRFLHFVDVKKKLPDTLQPLKNNLLSNFKKAEQSQILESALTISRNVKSIADASKEEIKNEESQIIKYEIEWHSKLTLSFACLILFFIGAPLGSIIRKGGLGWPLVIAVGFFLLFHLSSTMGRKFAREGVLPPLEGMWLAPAILLPIGIFITYKAISDSPLLDSESWVKFFNKIFKRNKF